MKNLLALHNFYRLPNIGYLSPFGNSFLLISRSFRLGRDILLFKEMLGKFKPLPKSSSMKKKFLRSFSRMICHDYNLQNQLKSPKNKRIKRNTKYKVWRDGFHLVLLYPYKKWEQRVNYIHHNPVDAQFVYHERDWKNSSYAAYEEGNLEQTNIKV